MANLDSYMPSVQAWVSDCPSHIVRSAVLEALRLVCDECPVWKDTSRTAFVEPVTEYPVYAPSGTRINKVESVRSLSGQPFRNWSWNGVSLIVPVDDIGREPVPYNVEVSLTPDIGVTEIPDAIFKQTASIVPYGARWQLLDMPGKPWSNDSKAEFYRRRFYHEVGILRGNIVGAAHRHELLQTTPLA